MIRSVLCICLLAMSTLLHAQTLTSSNLPILKITTSVAIPDEPKVNGNLEIIYNGPGERNNRSGDPIHLTHKIGIEIRGQSSQWFDKKGYGFEFRDSANDDVDTSFINMPSESDFVLHGPYSDKSLVRNALAYYLAGSIMDYAPRTEMVEVIINNEYVGIYLLTEKIKRNKNRVDINKLKSDELTGDDLTGGYIFKSDKVSAGDSYWYSKYNAIEGINEKPWFAIHYPKASDIRDVQFNYIKNHFDHFEDVMNSSSFESASTGYPSLIDVQSFVDFFFINELSRNVDGYRISTYFHKDKDSNGGKIKAGPVWDFNLGFGNADYCNGWMTSGWAYNFNSVCPQDGFRIPFWWNKMIASETFKKRTRDRWDDLRSAQLSTDRILEVYDSLTNLLQEAQVRNFQKFDVIGQYTWPNFNISNTYDGEVLWTRNWILNRLLWLDEQFSSFPSSISDTDYLTDFSIYPIPVEDYVIIDFVPKVSGQAQFQIFDVLGRRVWNQSMELVAGRHEHFNYSVNLDKGYFVFQVVHQNAIIQTGKFVSN